MTVNTKAVTWPYAYKTIAMATSTLLYTLPFSVSDVKYYNVNRDAEIALEIFPPLYAYQPVGLYMHLNYTFNASLPTNQQVLQGIFVRDTASPYVRPYGSSVENYMPLNIQAVAGNINISLDLSSLLTGLTTNVVYLSFPIANAEGAGRTAAGDVVNLWKLDLIYQTIGVRNEK